MLHTIMPTPLVDAVAFGRAHDMADMTRTALSVDATSAAGSVQAVLQTGGRFLLTLSMGLFVSYLLFLVGAVAVSAFVNLLRSVRARRGQAHKAAATAWAPRQVSPAAEPPVDLLRSGDSPSFRDGAGAPSSARDGAGASPSFRDGAGASGRARLDRVRT